MTRTLQMHIISPHEQVTLAACISHAWFFPTNFSDSDRFMALLQMHYAVNANKLIIILIIIVVLCASV